MLRLFYSLRDLQFALSAFDFLNDVDADTTVVELRRFRCYLDAGIIAYGRETDATSDSRPFESCLERGAQPGSTEWPALGYDKEHGNGRSCGRCRALEDRGVPEHRVRSTWDLALRLSIRFGSKEGRWSLARKRTMRLPPEADLLSVRYGGIRTPPAARRSFAGIEIQTAQGLIEFVPEQRVAFDAEWRGMLGRKLHVRVGVDLVDLDLAAH
jgi:hypothetical protein